MKRFLSVALVWIVILVFAAAYLVVMPPLTAEAERAAEADLTALTDAAFERIALANKNYEAIVSAADENILAKARAVERFIAHDDTLLATDALASLCEMLALYSVDVAGADGAVVAASSGAALGKSLIEDETLDWAAEVFDDPTKEHAEADAYDGAIRIGCVPRTDTEGVVLARGRDDGVAAARDAAKPEEVLRQMSFMQDTLAVVTGETDGAGIEDGRYVVRRTQDGVTVAASRALSRVYTVRNAATAMLVVMLFLSAISAIIIQTMLPRLRRSKPAREKMHREKREQAALAGETVLPEETGETPSAEAGPMEDAAAPAQPAETFPPDEPTEAVEAETALAEEPSGKAERKKKKKRAKLFEFVETPEPAMEAASVSEPASDPEPVPVPEPKTVASVGEPATEPAHAPAEEPALEREPLPKRKRERAPKAPGRPRETKPAKKKKPAADDGEAGFDKVF